ncbi:MAG: hypothetical protein U1B30_02630 [Pseudomonadota bacterium]|nr:hypothetical protein [Pseudomonadota bacterium]
MYICIKIRRIFIGAVDKADTDFALCCYASETTDTITDGDCASCIS